MNDITLVEHGYKIYPPNTIAYPHSDKLFQKCVKDDIGKKYFINIVEYKFYSNAINDTPSMNTRYSIDTILYKAGTGTAEEEMTIKFNSDDIDYVENRIEELWEFTGKGYYEKYHDNN